MNIQPNATDVIINKARTFWLWGGILYTL